MKIKKIIIIVLVLFTFLIASNWSLIFNPELKMHELIMKSDKQSIHNEWQIDYLVFRKVDLDYKPFNDISLLQMAVSKCNLELLNKIKPIVTTEQENRAISYAENIYDNYQCPNYTERLRELFRKHS
ncbi:hypothetical protein [Kangiella sp.]|uniref:hypothetical protein n=1 Tax=Kangiella sp. TaxID=1920245 RepID=UPI003A93F0C8